MESLETGQAGSPGHVAKHKGDAPGHAKGFGAAAQAFKRSAANERKRKKQRAPVGPRLSLPFIQAVTISLQPLPRCWGR